MRIPGFDWVPIPRGRDGIPRSSDAYKYPLRLVWHTTEGGNIASNVGTYADTGYYPHFTVEIGKRVAQHVDTALSVTTSSNAPGDGVETNTLRCLQVEVCGQAINMPNLTELQLKWLGEQFLAPIVLTHMLSLESADFARYPGSYGPNAAQRMSPQEWLWFAGNCGHQHIPGDQHGDPGGINMDRICYYARKKLNPAQPIEEVTESMMLEQIGRKYKSAMRPPVIFVDVATNSLWAVNGCNFEGSRAWGDGFMTIVPTSDGGKARIVGLDIAVKRNSDGEVVRDPDTQDPDRDWSKFRVVDSKGAEFVYPWK